MPEIIKLDKIALSVKSHRLLHQLLDENPKLKFIMNVADSEFEALVGVKNWVMSELKKSTNALKFYKEEIYGYDVLKKLNWKDIAAIRILDYIENAGRKFEDLNLKGNIAVSNPIRIIWLGVKHGTGGAKPYFYEDMLQLFRQFTGKTKRKVTTKEDVIKWMEKYPSGLDLRLVKLREENRDRIIKVIISKIDSGEIASSKYDFEEGLSEEQKYLKVLNWWDDKHFHLKFAIRTPELLNEMLGYSLDPDTMKVLQEAFDSGIPFFINPYYLSLLNIRVPDFAVGSDLAIRDYILYSKFLVGEFGQIIAWEKEDIVEPGKPNAAGWLLPSHTNIHRRYPEVAILIPDTMGRACGGLCASCQRMYNFQKGVLNFKLDKLSPDSKWSDKLKGLMDYYENDSQLRDVLITGGDALMSSDKSLKEILDAIYEMASNKINANKKRKENEKYAEIVRIRLGTRLPVYLPQRITPELIEILAEFKRKASKIGIKQFVIQTHFESPLEVTPEAEKCIKMLHKAGWIVTNQLVFTAAASRRGHTAQLRKVLNDVGVLTYYTLTVKGYMENYHNFATNARSVQEMMEEKVLGEIPETSYEIIKEFPFDAVNIKEKINALREKVNLPFLATDRNIQNLPGVGKSLTFRVIGITRYGRRILEFNHDQTRTHSPIINKLGKIVIIESKAIREYLEQLESMGEEISDYDNIYGYSIGETEKRISVYEYPNYGFDVNVDFTNLMIS